MTDDGIRQVGRRRLLAMLGGLAAVAPAVATPWAPAAAQDGGKAKVAFIGDSTADGIWGGMASLTPRNPCLKGSVELGRFAKNSTGLTRPDRFDWADEIGKVGAAFRPQIYVMSLGLNDRQSVVVRGKVTLDNSPDYPARYKERVAAVLRGAGGTRLLWVGLPAMRSAAADRDARIKNRLFAEAIAEFADPRMQYVEPWKLNSAGEDKFASYGPDQNGRIIQIRASDGEHFTPAGDMLVATYLLPRMIATLAQAGPRLGDACTG
jgi:hypothetical protein